MASDQIPAAAQKNPVLLRGGILHTVSGGILNSDILFREGKIAAIGNAIETFPYYEIIDIKGKHVYPGLLAASTSLGLVEIDAVRATLDYTEVGPLNPNVVAGLAYNPDSESIPVTRSNGILLANVTQQSGFLAGQSSLMMLDGWTHEEATLELVVGMNLFWPTEKNAWGQYSPQQLKKVRENNEQKLEKLNLLFEQARAYRKVMKAEKSGKRLKSQKHDLKLDSLIPVLDKKIPLLVHANMAREIEAAINWGLQQNVRIVIVGGHDAAMVVDLLVENDIPVIYKKVLALPVKRHDSYDQVYATPAELHAAGVKVAISGANYGFEAPHQRNLPYQAAQAMAFGLPADIALRSITLTPAEILGINDRVGSLSVGKDATLFIANGDILDIRTNVEQAYIRGKKVDMSDRHKQLHAKYREKYRQLGILE